MPANVDTIVAIATGAARAGIGVVRLSGPQARRIGETVVGRRLVPRRAQHGRFSDRTGETIDDGLALYFRGPRSYTGEDVVELQAHGAPTVLARLLRRCVQLGARAARPGEFTERAFHNGKLDLAQAEAVADLIAAGSEAAARAARRSLDGEFSRRVEAVTEHLVGLRTYLEAALDFPDEDIDFLAAPELRARLHATRAALAALRGDAARGQRLVDGLHVVIVGAPNAGKSSLLNALAGSERAIVTEHAGTTRDLVRETLDLEGLQLTLVDTAGLRAAPDAIEAEGIRRARAELARADLALAVLDATDAGAAAALAADLAGVPRVLWLHNKADLLAPSLRAAPVGDGEHLWLSARTGAGLGTLRARLHALAAGDDAAGGSFSARQRHLDALARTDVALATAAARLDEHAAELAAEELREAQAALGEITGTFDAEALLGRIFAGFCIGK
jgi:tRNA modification GTPase